MLAGFLKSLLVTLRHIFKKPVTVQYPHERREVYDRSRWRHVLLRHEDGLEKCIGCSLCVAACPADCINVIAGENTPDNKRSPGERYAKIFEINMLRCIFCGYCEDACPTGAIVLTENFELSGYNRDDFIYGKDRLLIDIPEGVALMKDILNRGNVLKYEDSSVEEQHEHLAHASKK